MLNISSLIVLFSYGKVKDIFGDKDQISSGEDKMKVQQGCMGKETPNGVGFIVQNSHY